MSKPYGLIQPDKYKALKIGELKARPSVFQDDSDSDAEAPKPTGLTNKTLKKQDKLDQSKALEEDPTVYQYDEIYDEMDQKRKESLLAKKDVDKKPKYISKLLVAADRRKRENERRIERQVQKEREEEGEEFKDKESFVTSAYRKKLEEMKELEEQERREEYLESIGDVTKQDNLDGFYRHLYDQKINHEDNLKKEDASATVTTDTPEIKEEPKSPEDRKRSVSETQSDDTTNKKKARKYRSRKDTHSDEEVEPEETPEVKKEHLPSNLDADSDFSIDSSDSEDEDKPAKSKVVEKPAEETPAAPTVDTKTEETPLPKLEPKEEETTKEEEEEVKPKKPKVDIWKKRTVGEAFDEALKRYYERKSAREAAGLTL